MARYNGCIKGQMRHLASNGDHHLDAVRECLAIIDFDYLFENSITLPHVEFSEEFYFLNDAFFLGQPERNGQNPVVRTVHPPHTAYLVLGDRKHFSTVDHNPPTLRFIDHGAEKLEIRMFE
jgi:hypothetical protein